MTPAGLSSVACLSCRLKHAKCDGHSPCARCTRDGRPCEFVASNRGYRSCKRKRVDTAQSVVSRPSDTYAQFALLDSPPSTNPALFNLTPASERLRESPAFEYGEDSHAIDAYFTYFHPSHPILILPAFYRADGWGPLLRSVIILIGSRYSNTDLRDIRRARERVEVCMLQRQSEQAETVQALLLYSIALHALAEPQAASERLEEAIMLALSLKLNHDLSVQSLASQRPLQAESYRRTWWELFVIDTLYAALHQRPTFTTKHIPVTTALPCEETIFSSGDCALDGNAHLQDLEHRTIFAADKHLSSAAYRIEAHRILSRVLSNTLDADAERSDDVAQGIDAVLSSWPESLPQDKFDVIDASGRCDEMLFQARMIIYCSSIYMHLPRSSLTTPSPLAQGDICARRAPRSTSLGRQHAHTCKAMTAAKDLSILASLGSDMTRRTPFFTCSLVLSAVVHLSAISVNATATSDPLKDRVSQSVGLLKTLARTWPLAASVMDQVRATAAHVLRQSDQETYVPTPSNSTPWSNNEYLGPLSWAYMDEAWLDTTTES